MGSPVTPPSIQSVNPRWGPSFPATIKCGVNVKNETSGKMYMCAFPPGSFYTIPDNNADLINFLTTDVKVSQKTFTSSENIHMDLSNFYQKSDSSNQTLQYDTNYDVYVIIQDMNGNNSNLVYGGQGSLNYGGQIYLKIKIKQQNHLTDRFDNNIFSPIVTLEISLVGHSDTDSGLQTDKISFMIWYKSDKLNFHTFDNLLQLYRYNYLTWSGNNLDTSEPTIIPPDGFDSGFYISYDFNKEGDAKQGFSKQEDLIGTLIGDVTRFRNLSNTDVEIHLLEHEYNNQLTYTIQKVNPWQPSFTYAIETEIRIPILDIDRWNPYHTYPSHGRCRGKPTLHKHASQFKNITYKFWFNSAVISSSHSGLITTNNMMNLVINEKFNWPSSQYVEYTIANLPNSSQEVELEEIVIMAEANFTSSDYIIILSSSESVHENIHISPLSVSVNTYFSYDEWSMWN